VRRGCGKLREVEFQDKGGQPQTAGRKAKEKNNFYYNNFYLFNSFYHHKEEDYCSLVKVK